MKLPKQKLTFAEHQAIGLELKRVRAYLMHLSCLLPNTYGKTSRVGKLSRRAYDVLIPLRSELEDQMYLDCPGDGDSFVYYGSATEHSIEPVSEDLTVGLRKYTVFCQEAGARGTIHIDSVMAEDLESAITAGKQGCIDDWSVGFDDEEGESPWNMDTVHCLGVATGDLEIVHWEDQCD